MGIKAKKELGHSSLHLADGCSKNQILEEAGIEPQPGPGGPPLIASREEQIAQQAEPVESRRVKEEGRQAEGQRGLSDTEKGQGHTEINQCHLVG